VQLLRQARLRAASEGPRRSWGRKATTTGGDAGRRRHRLARRSRIEAVIGSDFDDTLIGDTGDNAFAGGPGDDTLDGAGGVDQATFFDSFEPVVVDLSAGTATGWGTDTLQSIEDATGSAHADVIVGDSGSNTIAGGSGPDSLDGDAGDDVLVGGGGADEADGGDGSDACDAETETACETEPGSSAFGIAGFGSSRRQRAMRAALMADVRNRLVDGPGGGAAVQGERP
jgi:hypothetical protein